MWLHMKWRFSSLYTLQILDNVADKIPLGGASQRLFKLIAMDKSKEEVEHLQEIFPGRVSEIEIKEMLNK